MFILIISNETFYEFSSLFSIGLIAKNSFQNILRRYAHFINFKYNIHHFLHYFGFCNVNCKITGKFLSTSNNIYTVLGVILAILMFKIRHEWECTWVVILSFGRVFVHQILLIRYCKGIYKSITSMPTYNFSITLDTVYAKYTHSIINNNCMEFVKCALNNSNIQLYIPFDRNI